MESFSAEVPLLVMISSFIRSPPQEVQLWNFLVGIEENDPPMVAEFQPGNDYNDFIDDAIPIPEDEVLKQWKAFLSFKKSIYLTI